MKSDVELKVQLDELLDKNVFGTVNNEEFKSILVHILDERKKYKEIINQTPNDMELGRIIRTKFGTK
jgi:hypothetical protein